MPNDSRTTQRPVALATTRRDTPDARPAEPAEINGVPRDEIESTLRHRIAYTALSRVGRDLECEVAMVAWSNLQIADAIDALREQLAPPPRRS